MMQATQEQLKALTFPALPEVVQRGTPVLWCSKAFLSPEPGVIIMGRDLCLVGIDSTTGYVGWEDLLVDLTDATGRAHVAWAIAGDTSDSRLYQVVSGGWLVAGRLYYPSAALTGTTVPTLRGIDRRDGTVLPDGTKLVDVLALQAIALHVLGTREVPSGTSEVPAGPEKSPGGA